MREVKIKVYDFKDLDFETREKVVNNYREDDYFFVGEDIVETIKAFCSYFNLKLQNYSLGDAGSNFIDIDEDSIPKNKKDLRISKKFLNGYRLTGICYDYDILKPLTRPFKGKDSKELIEECLDAIIDTYNRELEYWYSNICIEEEIESNGYEFLINGDIYNPQN